MNEQESIIDKLPEDAKDEARKMTAGQMLKLSIQVKALFNLSCVQCKEKMLLDPQNVKNISDWCLICQQDKRIINCFKRLERLHNDINNN